MFRTLINAWKIADLRKKLLFTALIVLIFRIGSAIPVPFTNIGSEGMFHLGKNGKLYTSVSCGDEWYEYHEISNEEFERIREEAINNLED